MQHSSPESSISRSTRLRRESDQSLPGVLSVWPHDDEHRWHLGYDSARDLAENPLCGANPPGRAMFLVPGIPIDFRFCQRCVKSLQAIARRFRVDSRRASG